MAFQNKLQGVPRDADAMDGRAGAGTRFVVGTLVLFIALVVTAFFYVSALGPAPTAAPATPATTTDISRTPPPPATEPTP
jgi:hypothetical protein